MAGKVGAGIVDVLCTVAEGRYGIPRSELLYVAALEPEEVSAPGARVPANAFLAQILYVLERTGDRALGLRFAEAMDLRTQGFWGYSFISCPTLRQAVDLLLRFQHLRHGSPMRFWVEDGWACFERTNDSDAPVELEALIGDAFLACFCFHRLRWAPRPCGTMQAWVRYPEEPHHRELRALVVDAHPKTRKSELPGGAAHRTTPPPRRHRRLRGAGAASSSEVVASSASRSR